MQNTAVYAPITFEEIVMVMINGKIRFQAVKNCKKEDLKN